MGQVILWSLGGEIPACDKTMGEGQPLTCVQRKKVPKGDRAESLRTGGIQKQTKSLEEKWSVRNSGENMITIKQHSLDLAVPVTR